MSLWVSAEVARKAALVKPKIYYPQPKEISAKWGLRDGESLTAYAERIALTAKKPENASRAVLVCVATADGIAVAWRVSFVGTSLCSSWADNRCTMLHSAKQKQAWYYKCAGFKISEFVIDANGSAEKMEAPQYQKNTNSGGKPMGKWVSDKVKKTAQAKEIGKAVGIASAYKAKSSSDYDVLHAVQRRLKEEASCIVAGRVLDHETLGLPERIINNLVIATQHIKIGGGGNTMVYGTVNHKGKQYALARHKMYGLFLMDPSIQKDVRKSSDGLGVEVRGKNGWYTLPFVHTI